MKHLATAALVANIAAICLLAFRAVHSDTLPPAMEMVGVRDAAIKINHDMAAILGNRAELLNVGQSNSVAATGDPINEALRKIDRNLQKIQHCQGAK